MRVGEVTFSEPVDALIRRLEAVNAEDDAAERRKKWLVGGIVVSVLLGFFGIPVAAETGFWPMPVGGLAGLVVCIVLLVRTNRHDLDDRKIEAALRFLTIARADVPAQGVVSLRVDFRDAAVGGKPVTEPGATKPGANRWEHAWLDVTAPLADGNEVTVSVVSDVIRKSKRKRKYTKVRERIAETLDCTIRLDGRYGDPAAAAERLRARGAPEHLAVRRVVAVGDRLRVRLDTPDSITVTGRGGTTNLTPDTRVTADTLLGTLLWAYGGLAPEPSAGAA
jgi:hypothetical protein